MDCLHSPPIPAFNLCSLILFANFLLTFQASVIA